MDFYYNSQKKDNEILQAQEEFMKYEEDTYDVLGSVFFRELSNVKQLGEYKTSNVKCRFDLLSYNHYQTSDYWWILMEYNDYITFDIDNNDKYKIPDPIDINRLIHKLVIKQNIERNK